MENNKTLQHIDTLRNDLKSSIDDLSSDFIADWGDLTNNSYISDAIREYSDTQIDEYTSDLLEWAKSNRVIIENANADLGTTTGIIEQIMQAQYYNNTNILYQDIDNIIKLLALEYMVLINLDNVTKDIIDNILDEIVAFDQYNRFNDILDVINDNLNQEA